MSEARPLMRYFGGKWAIRNWIAEQLPPHVHYCEPFAGAASILLTKPRCPGVEILNDTNDETWNVFHVLRDQIMAGALIESLRYTPFSRRELVNSREPATGPIERARRTLVRSFQGIEPSGTKGKKSGFRTSRTGAPKVRDTAKDWDNWRNRLEFFRDRLSTVTLESRDAIELAGTIDSPDSLLYVDPPYAHETREATRYAKDSLDHNELCLLLLKTSSMVVLSGYNCQEYRPLEKAGWKVIEKDVRAHGATERTEFLWISPNCKREGDLFS